MRKVNFKILPASLGALLLLLLVVLFIQNIVDNFSDNAGNELIQKGNSAPNFTATSLNGELVNLEDYKGKAVLVNFWASWCGPCQREMPFIQDVYENYQDQGFEVLAINFQEKEEAIHTYLNKNPDFDFTVLMDDGTIYDQYKTNGLPYSFFINRDGTIESSYRGEISEEALHVFIQEILYD